MKCDVIIIGTGVAGMTAAVTLAKEGLGVLALEQAPRAGGLTRRFRRGALTFPTGVHSVGSLDPDQMLWRCFKYMGMLDRLDLARMNADGFIEYSFPGESFRVPIGPAAFRDRLLDRFPSEKTPIDRFFDDMLNTTKHFPIHTVEFGPERPLDDMQRGSLESYLDSLTSCKELKLILGGTNIFYGMPPEECPLYVHFLVLDSFLKSAWRIDERSRPLAAAFEDCLRAHGGHIRCSARVASIDSAEGEVRGVSLADGERIEARRIIYTGHPRHLLTLCADRAMRPAFRQRVAELPETPGVFGVAIEWKDEDCPVGLTDALLFQSSDVRKQYDQRLLSDNETPHFIYCAACPTPQTQDGAHSVAAMVVSEPEEWRRWAGTHVGERPPDYAETKARLAERVFNVVRARWPHAASRMKAVDTFSPLTFRDYTLTPTGGAYGVKKCVGAGRSGRLTHDTRIKGLFLAGQSVVLPGVIGTTISSIGACGSILGSQYLVERIARESE